MPRPTASQPTEVELQILGVFWESGPSTAREIHNAILESRETNYSTTVKMLSVMLDKGLVKRDDSVASNIPRCCDSKTYSDQASKGSDSESV